MALLTKEFTLAQLVLSAPDCKTGADWGSNPCGLLRFFPHHMLKSID